MKYPFASHLIAEIAPPMGIRVELEPEFEFAGELIFPNGTRHLFRNTNFNVNPAGSTEIAKDKGYTNYFLRKHGFHVPRCRTFFAPRLNANLAAELRRGPEEALCRRCLMPRPRPCSRWSRRDAIRFGWKSPTPRSSSRSIRYALPRC